LAQAISAQCFGKFAIAAMPRKARVAEGKAPEPKERAKPAPVEKTAGKAGGKGAPKRRAQERVITWSADDDERTAWSKKVSWVLRHGIGRLSMEVSPDGWVKLSDVLATKIMEGAPEEKVLAMIEASNEQKLRYELRETDGVQMIRAVTKVRGTTTAPVDPAEPTEEPATDFSLRQDAPAFVPNAVRFQAQLASATAAMMSPLPGYPPFAAPYPWPGLGGFSGFPFMVPGMPPLANSERYQGRIKSFNTEKGFGFIESAGAHAQFGRDVFVHRTVIGSFGVGAEVTFTVETNKQGMPQAKHLMDAQHLAFTGGKDSRKGKGKGGQGKGAGRKGAKKGEKEEGGQTQVVGGTAAETAQQEAPQDVPQEASQEAPHEAPQELSLEASRETSPEALQEASLAAPQDGAAAESAADVSVVAVKDASPAPEASVGTSAE